MRAPQNQWDFAHSRAAAILGRSFCGHGVEQLLNSASVSALAAKLFPDQKLALPGKLLVQRLQQLMAQKNLAEVLSICKVFNPLPELLAQDLVSLEYRWLKASLPAWAARRSPPELPGLGRYGQLHRPAWPDPAGLLVHSRWSWLPPQIGKTENTGLERRLDRQFYGELLACCDRASPPDSALYQLIHTEIALQNASWALRMRGYYGWGLQQARTWLVGTTTDLLGAARQVFSLPEHAPAAWAGWRFVAFLPSGASSPWVADPVKFELNAALWLYAKTWRLFHAEPISLGSIYAFFRLKHFEAEIVSSLAEGIELGMDENQMRSLVRGAA